MAVASGDRERRTGWTAAALARRSASISPGLSTATGAMVLVSALLWPALSLATGVLAAAVPPAVGRGMGSPAGRHVELALVSAATVYVLIQVVGPLWAAVSDVLTRRIDEAVATGLMRTVSGPRGIAHLEDPIVLDLLSQAQGSITGTTTGAAMASLGGMAAVRLQGIAALIIVGRFRWWLPPMLAAGQIASYSWRRRHWIHVTGVVFDRTDTMRRADYLRRLALRPEAAKETRVFALDGWLVERYRDNYLSTMQQIWRERRTGSTAALGVSTMLLLIEGGALFLVARAGARGTIGLAATIVYAQSVLATGALGRFDMDSLRLEDGLASFRRLQALEAAIPGALHQLDGVLPVDGLPRRLIRFEGVRFRYPGRDTAVFDGLDLDIVAGQSLAVVGVNGAGKTTLIKLLARLYDVEGGRITVDGTDVRELDPVAWQRHVAAIFQDFVQYPVSAHDNVAFGAVARSGDRAAVEDAARRAGALDIVAALPGGWDTILNRQFTGGADLSGGEWQRIALARALFAVAGGAGVLVLDEPTASLDVRAEANLYDRFLDLTRGVTTIVVSHRFSTVRRAQRIVVLEHGRVVEDGSHDALVALGGRYAAMYALQASRFTESTGGE
jgi:ATP-binding cassette subfamily B protein